MQLVIREARVSEYGAIAKLTVAAYRTIDPDLGTYEARIRDVAGRAAVATVVVAVEPSVDERFPGGTLLGYVLELEA